MTYYKSGEKYYTEAPTGKAGFVEVDPKNIGNISALESYIKPLPSGAYINPAAPAAPATPASANTPEIPGISLTMPSVSAEERQTLEENTILESEARKEGLRLQYEPKIQVLREKAAGEERQLKGQFGTERRLDTAALAFIKYIDSENQKNIADLEKQRDIAIQSEDYKMMQLLDERILNLQTEKRQQVKDMMDLIEFKQKQAKATDAETIGKNISTIFNDLTGDETRDNEILNTYADNLGVSLADLTKSLDDYQKTLSGLKGGYNGLAKKIIAKPSLWNLFAQTDSEKQKIVAEIYKINPNFDFDSLGKVELDENVLKALAKNPSLLDKIIPVNERDNYVSELVKMGVNLNAIGISEDEKKATTFDAIKLEAAALFEEDRARNEDKKISPDLYGQMRARVPVQYRDDFDRAFKNLLSEETQRKFGIGGEENQAPASVIGNVKALINKNAPLEDINNYLNFSGYNPESPQFQNLLKDYTLAKNWWEF